MRPFRAGLGIVVVFVLCGAVFHAAHATDIVVDNATTYENTYAVGHYEAGTADVAGNSVTVKAGGVVGKPSDPMNGGHDVYGGLSNSTGDVYNNTVTITGGRVYSSNGGSQGGRVLGGGATPGMPRGIIRNNIVRISGGQVDNTVRGGYAYDTEVRENRVEISGGTIGNPAYTNVGEVYGGYSDSGSALRNVAVVSGGIIKGSVAGGQAEDGTLADVAEYNEVYVSGGSIAEGVAGGSADAGGAAHNYVEITGGSIRYAIAGGYSTSSYATNNTVKIGAGAVLDAGIDIYGGMSPGAGDVFTGNTLYLDGFRGTVRQINNFEKYHFHLPASLANGGILVSTTGAATSLTGSSVEGITIAPGSSLTTSHTVTLLGNVTGVFADTTLQAAKGASLLLDVTVKLDGGRLTATFGDAHGRAVNPQGKALGQSRTGGLSLLGQGADLVADTVFDSALAGAAAAGSTSGAVAFGSSSASRYRVKTGSHVDSDGWSLLAGLAWKGQGPDCSGWIAGAFFETGRGSYDGYNSFSNGNVHSSGDLSYYGGGVMGQYRLMNGLRAEGSFRVGRLDTDYRASGFLGAAPKYDLDTTYVSSHFGVGYDRDLTGRLNLDLSTKYLWTRQTSKGADILGERYRFDSVDSHRIRAGGRLSYAGCVLSPYAGAYFEYEFGGKATTRNQTQNIRYASPTTRGTTFVGELGVKFTPTRRMDVDLSVQGHTGRRDGVQGRLAVGFSF